MSKWPVYLTCVLINVCVAAVVIVAVYVTKSAWPMLGLVCMSSVGSSGICAQCGTNCGCAKKPDGEKA